MLTCLIFSYIRINQLILFEFEQWRKSFLLFLMVISYLLLFKPPGMIKYLIPVLTLQLVNRLMEPNPQRHKTFLTSLSSLNVLFFWFFWLMPFRTLMPFRSKLYELNSCKIQSALQNVKSSSENKLHVKNLKNLTGVQEQSQMDEVRHKSIIKSI